MEGVLGGRCPSHGAGIAARLEAEGGVKTQLVDCRCFESLLSVTAILFFCQSLHCFEFTLDCAMAKDSGFQLNPFLFFCNYL